MVTLCNISSTLKVVRKCFSIYQEIELKGNFANTLLYRWQFQTVHFKKKNSHIFTMNIDFSKLCKILEASITYEYIYTLIFILFHVLYIDTYAVRQHD